MKKLITIALVAGLVLAAFGPAEAKKKKKKPVQVDQNYYLRNLTDGCAPEAYQLLTSDGPDGATCGDYAGGAANEIFVNAFGEPCEPTGQYGCGNLTYVAAEGIPFKLDATKPITGMIAVGAFAAEQGAGNGVGQTTLVIQLSGTKDGEPVMIGEATATYTVTPNQDVYENEFEIKPDPGLDVAEFTTLELNLYNRGPSTMHSWYMLDDPASFFTIPQWR